MKRPVHATVALSLFAALVALAVGLACPAARADDPTAQKQAEARRKKALEQDALSMNYPAAVKELRTAIEGCDHDRCGPSLKGALFRDLGAMQMMSGSIEDGRASFAQALAYDPSLELDAAYKNPMLEGLWADAKKRTRAAAPGSAAPGPTPGAVTGAATAGAEEPPPTEASQPTGEFIHAPASEQAVRTPLPVYVECRVGPDAHAGNCDDYVYMGTDKLSRVAIKYRSSAMTDYKPLELQKMGSGYGGLIPCADVTVGTMRYYVQGYSEANDPIAASGNRNKPYMVVIRPRISGPGPSLPGQPPPESCAEAAVVECPPDFPGCHPAKKAGGLPCEMNSECKSNSCIGSVCIEKKEEGEDCESDDDCGSGSCKEGKCGAAPEAKSSAPKVWIGVAASLDFFVMPAADDVCALNAGGTAAVNTAGYSCVDPATNAAFPPDFATNMSIANAGHVGGGVARGNVRLMATIDFALRRHVFLGARAGYVFPTMQASVPGPAFAPVHLEARVTVVFDGDATPSRLAPEVFLGAGAGEFDAFVPTSVRLVNQTTTQDENAWITAGPAFGTAGVGLRWLVGPKAALTGALKAEGAFGGTAGFLFGIAPELGLQFGL